MKALIVYLSALIIAAGASAEPFVVIVRHAEKATNDPKDPDLSQAGNARAELLARILKDFEHHGNFRDRIQTYTGNGGANIATARTIISDGYFRYLSNHASI
jgi:hypothetical protein